MQEVKIDNQGFEKYAKLTKRKGTKVKITPPQTTIRNTKKRTVTNKILNLSTKKDRNCTRRRNWKGSGKYAIENFILHKKDVWSSRDIWEWSRKQLQWKSWLCYQHTSIARLSIGSNLPKIEEEWLAAEVLSVIKEDIKKSPSNKNTTAELMGLWLGIIIADNWNGFKRAAGGNWATGRSKTERGDRKEATNMLRM